VADDTGAGAARMSCREVLDVLAEYLDHALSADRLTYFERHLAGCEPCRAYLATYRATRALGAAAGRVTMPAEMRRRLRAFLIEELTQAAR
jgi:anti-sigma factor (TIGR02949 family)